MSFPLLEGVALILFLILFLIYSFKATTKFHHIFHISRLALIITEAPPSQLPSSSRRRTAGCSFLAIPSTYSSDAYFQSQTKTVSRFHFSEIFAKPNYHYRHQVSAFFRCRLFACIRLSCFLFYLNLKLQVSPAYFFELLQTLRKFFDLKFLSTFQTHTNPLSPATWLLPARRLVHASHRLTFT
jgi:hypothetical protein